MADLDTDRLTLATPEGVSVDLELAGIGSRGLALLVDQLIQWALILALGLLLALLGRGEWAFAAIVVLGFLINLFYFVPFEVLDQGRSPGKRLARLRVVQIDGSPVTFLASVIRNLLRIVDALPTAYGVAMITVLASKRLQRLGDMAAGTVVIHDRPRPAPAAEVAPTVRYELAGVAATWDVSAISAEEVVAVRAFLARRRDLEIAPRNRLAAQFDAALRPRVPGVAPGVAAEDFLEAVVWAKTAR
jgi:uncharacterized RDD family membrane protein YckC